MLKQLLYEKEDLKKQLYWNSYRIINNERHRHELTVWRKINNYERAFKSLLLLQRLIDLEERLDTIREEIVKHSKSCRHYLQRGLDLSVKTNLDILVYQEERYTKLKKERDEAYGNYRRRFEKA